MVFKTIQNVKNFLPKTRGVFLQFIDGNTDANAALTAKKNYD